MSGKVKTWKRRWFVLKGGELLFYKSPVSGQGPLRPNSSHCKADSRWFPFLQHKTNYGAGRDVSALAALAEDPGSIPSTYMAGP